jgi:hypothetical protein
MMTPSLSALSQGPLARLIPMRQGFVDFYVTGQPRGIELKRKGIAFPKTIYFSSESQALVEGQDTYPDLEQLKMSSKAKRPEYGPLRLAEYEA